VQVVIPYLTIPKWTLHYCNVYLFMPLPNIFYIKIYLFLAHHVYHFHPSKHLDGVVYHNIVAFSNHSKQQTIQWLSADVTNEGHNKQTYQHEKPLSCVEPQCNPVTAE